MRETTKKTAIAVLAGLTAMSMLAGCGEEKELDGTKTVATVNGTEIPLGMVSLSVRQQQAQTEAMYKSFMGSTDMNIWDTEAEEGLTYGQQAVEQTLTDTELMYIMKEKAPDYSVEVTQEDQTAIAEAASKFMEANSEETIKALGVNEEQVKTYLELQTYKKRMYDAIVAEVDTEVPDDLAQQSAFTYVSINTSGDDLTDEEKEEKKGHAEEILEKMTADPDADMNEIAKESDDTYSALSGTFTTNESDDENVSASVYPDEVIEVLRGLEDGEVGEELIQTETGYYIVRLDEKFDEEATESKKESIITSRESDLYAETTEAWLEEADIKVEEKVLETLTLTDSHAFTIQTPAAEETVEADTEDEAAAEETENTGDTDEAAESDTEVSDEEDGQAAGNTAEPDTGAEDAGDDDAENDSTADGGDDEEAPATEEK